MNNVLQLKKNQSLRDLYDLKGSTYKRQSSNEEILSGAPKKDLNAIKEKLKMPIHDERYKKLLI